MNVKHLLLPAVIAAGIASLVGLAGCNKSSGNNYSSMGTMSATVNGAPYTAKTYVVSAYLSAYRQLIMQGDSIVNKDTTQIEVVVPYIPAVNQVVYTDSVQLASLAYIAPGKEYDAYFGLGHGVITLTSEDTVNHHVAGTFSGVLYNYVNTNDSVVITNGVFSSSYIIE